MSYTEQVMKHFKNPKNQGQIPSADAIGQVGNPMCGDIMKIYIKVNRKPSVTNRLNDVIKDIKFETLGCAAAIACSSILTEMAKGLSLKKAFNIQKADIVKGLGELPPIKIHCSVLASDGLKVAIQNYLKKMKVLDQYPEIKQFKVLENH